MTIRLLLGMESGSTTHSPGAILNLNPALEADLVSTNRATWVTPPALTGDAGKPVQAATIPPGGGIEKFTVSGIRRADGTVAPLIDTGDGWELLNGWHPRQLFEDGSPGDIFDNRSSALLKSVTVPAVSDLAGDGDPVLVRSGLLTPGRVSTALNTVRISPVGW